MKIITKTIYVAKDGKEFSDENKCKQYEFDGCVELEPLPNYGDHVKLNHPNLHFYLNGDGSCYYATKTRRSHIQAGIDHPDWATHIIYFGK